MFQLSPKLVLCSRRFNPKFIMANIASQRIQREYREVVRSEEVTASGIQLGLVGDDFTELEGTIKGPPDTPYEGGTYKLEIKVRQPHLLECVSHVAWVMGIDQWLNQQYVIQ